MGENDSPQGHDPLYAGVTYDPSRAEIEILWEMFLDKLRRGNPELPTSNRFPAADELLARIEHYPSEWSTYPELTISPPYHVVETPHGYVVHETGLWSIHATPGTPRTQLRGAPPPELGLHAYWTATDPPLKDGDDPRHQATWRPRMAANLGGTLHTPRVHFPSGSRENRKQLLITSDGLNYSATFLTEQEVIRTKEGYMEMLLEHISLLSGGISGRSPQSIQEHLSTRDQADNSFETNAELVHQLLLYSNQIIEQAERRHGKIVIRPETDLTVTFMGLAGSGKTMLSLTLFHMLTTLFQTENIGTPPPHLTLRHTEIHSPSSVIDYSLLKMGAELDEREYWQIRRKMRQRRVPLELYPSPIAVSLVRTFNRGLFHPQSGQDFLQWIVGRNTPPKVALVDSLGFYPVKVEDPVQMVPMGMTAAELIQLSTFTDGGPIIYLYPPNVSHMDLYTPFDPYHAARHKQRGRRNEVLADMSFVVDARQIVPWPHPFWDNDLFIPPAHIKTLIQEDLKQLPDARDAAYNMLAIIRYGYLNKIAAMGEVVNTIAQDLMKENHYTQEDLAQFGVPENLKRELARLIANLRETFGASAEIDPDMTKSPIALVPSPHLLHPIDALMSRILLTRPTSRHFEGLQKPRKPSIFGGNYTLGP